MGKHFTFAPATERRKRAYYALSMQNPLNGVVQNMKDRYEERKRERLVKSGINQRLVFLPLAQS